MSVLGVCTVKYVCEVCVVTDVCLCEVSFLKVCVVSGVCLCKVSALINKHVMSGVCEMYAQWGVSVQCFLLVVCVCAWCLHPGVCVLCGVCLCKVCA